MTKANALYLLGSVCFFLSVLVADAQGELLALTGSTAFFAGTMLVVLRDRNDLDPPGAP